MSGFFLYRLSDVEGLTSFTAEPQAELCCAPAPSSLKTFVLYQSLTANLCFTPFFCAFVPEQILGLRDREEEEVLEAVSQGFCVQKHF